MTDILVGDFETTTDPYDCRVWLWGLINLDGTGFIHGHSITRFFAATAKIRSSTIYFHNLKFDGFFMLDWLLNNGFKHTTDYARRGEFSTTIDNMGKFYQIIVRWENGSRTEFRDSLKKLPMPVGDIAVTFGMPMGKGEIDYHKPRPIDYRANAVEVDYVHRDVSIVAAGLSVQLSQGLTKMTVGADSLNDLTTIMGGKDSFKRVFPVLPPLVDEDIRKAYRGGFAYAAPKYAGRIVECNGSVYDVNSLYPAVMYDKPLPYGVPDWFDGEPPKDRLWIASVTFTAKLKADHIPCIQVKGSPHFAATIYQEKFDEPQTMFITSVDFDLWNRQYHIDLLAWNGGYSFDSATGLLSSFIDKWTHVKENSTGGMRALAKLQLNSLYGKFATNPDVTGRIPILKDGVVSLIPGPEETRDPVYTPAGVFITAHARDITVSAAQSNFDHFAYADTDSLHLTTDTPVGLDIDPRRRGAWKHEYGFKRGVWVRAKAYAEELHDGSLEVHVAGLPRSAAGTARLEDFITGRTFEGKLTPVRVPGGVVLKDVGFELAPHTPYV